MNEPRIRTPADCEPFRPDPSRRNGRLRRLIKRVEQFIFDPTPADVRLMWWLFWTGGAMLTFHILFATLRGRGLL